MIQHLKARTQFMAPSGAKQTTVVARQLESPVARFRI